MTRILDETASTPVDRIRTVTRKSFPVSITEIIVNLLNIYSLVLFARALFSWFDPGFTSTIGRILFDITEPVIAPVRQVIRPVGGLDLSIMVTIILIVVLERLIVSTV